MEHVIPPSVLKNTFCISDLHRRADILQTFLEHFFFGTTPKTGSRAELIVSFYAQGDPETVQHAHAVAAWGDAVLDLYTEKNVYERIKLLKSLAASLPKLTLYIPVHFALSQIERIGEWCRAQVQPDILLDIKIDPEAVGGCAFVYKNTFHDFSFSYFADKQRAAILSLVQKL
ncbi:MAG: hypothetical protein JWM46_275 [Candidatus Kaiserbacteria bacterium]|nr:hypothetical protein [Candidatus Kaiserbacteria bacterium]